MLCEAKLPFLLSLLSYLFSGNDNFLEKREERKEKSEKNKKKRQSSVENCRFFLAEKVGFSADFSAAYGAPRLFRRASAPPWRKKQFPELFFAALRIPSYQNKRTINDGSFVLAEKVGFEPTNGFIRYTISSRAPSTS